MHVEITTKLWIDDATIPGDSTDEREYFLRQYAARSAQDFIETLSDDAVETGWYCLDDSYSLIKIEK
jgi:hypothetical protein